MRWISTIFLFLSAAMNLHAETFVYVSVAPEHKIQVYRLDPKDGNLTAVETAAVDGTPGCLSLDPRKKYLFASIRSNSTLASFCVDAATGKLKPINVVALPKGEDGTFLSTDQTGRWLFSASYRAGKIVVHGIGEDGAIKTPAVQTVETVKTAHCVGVDSANRWVFVPHVTPNAVFQYHLDAATGKITQVGEATAGAEKSGPRHFAFHPTQSLAFTSDEVGNNISAYRFDTEKGLKALQAVSTLPADYKGKNTTAEVKVHPSGKFVWVSNRGHDSLAGFAIDAKNGNLTALGQTATEATPRSFDISPDGRFLIAAGEGSGKLATYKVDLDTGKLTPSRTLEVGKSLTWVRIVQLGEK